VCNDRIIFYCIFFRNCDGRNTKLHTYRSAGKLRVQFILHSYVGMFLGKKNGGITFQHTLKYGYDMAEARDFSSSLVPRPALRLI
jgi:hypothetical protein